MRFPFNDKFVVSSSCSEKSLLPFHGPKRDLRKLRRSTAVSDLITPSAKSDLDL
jgi:hypothetical protein